MVAKPGFAVLLAYNPGLVGASDIPDAWHSRFPATLEVTSNWAALAALGVPQWLVAEAMRLDRQRTRGEDGLCWTPQFRDIESLWRMTERVGERAALAFFASNLYEQVQAGKIQDAEAAAACRMLDQAATATYASCDERHGEPARLPAGGHVMTPANRTIPAGVYLIRVEARFAEPGLASGRAESGLCPRRPIFDRRRGQRFKRRD